MKQLFIYFIKGYQVTFGYLFPKVCRFAPSCSCYAIEAINVHGIFKGTLLTVWRILRCNPFFAGGWDPVPPRDHDIKFFSDYKVFRKEGRHE